MNPRQRPSRAPDRDIRIAKLAILLPLLATSLAGPVAADWLQYGGDAGRRGQAEGAAPDWPDTAYELQVFSEPEAHLAWPIIVGEYAYLLVNGTDDGASAFNPTLAGRADLYRLHIPSAFLEHLNAYDVPLYHLAYHDAAFYASGHDRLFRLASDGRIEWDRPVRAVLGEQVDERPQTINGATCGAPVVDDEGVFVACVDAQGQRRQTVVEGFDHSGRRLWAQPYLPQPDNPLDCPLDPDDLATVEACPYWSASTATNAGMPIGSNAPQMSRNGEFLYVVQRAAGDTGSTAGTAEGSPDFAYGGWEIHAVAARDGTGTKLFGNWNARAPAVPCCDRLPVLPPTPVGDKRWSYVMAGDVYRFDAVAPRPWSHDLQRNLGQPDRIGLGAHMVPYRGDLLVPSASLVHRINAGLEDVAGFTPYALPADEAWVSGPMALAGDVLIGPSHRILHTGRGPVILNAVDAQTGAGMWRFPLGAPATFAVADGVIVALDLNGAVTVIGETAGSLQPVADLGSRYPGVGEPVVVDLSRTGAGVFGPPTQYRAEWGDGTTTEWHVEPLLRHVYSTAVEASARVFVRNDANQTASIPVVFHVGQRDPAVTWFNSPLHPDFQELTFFLLGFLITGLLALIGLYRAGRKRRRLRRELRELEADHRRLVDDLDACQDMLARRRALAHALFLEKKLEEAHSSFLEKRIDDLLRNLRVGAVDDELSFLPHGLVMRLKRLLADARVDAYEHSHFMAALDQARLASRERERARRIVEDWFRRDEGVRRGPPRP